MNPKAETCEDLQSRRKRLHLGMCRRAGEDLERKALKKEAEFQVTLTNSTLTLEFVNRKIEQSPAERGGSLVASRARYRTE